MKLRNWNHITSSAKRLLPAGRIWLIATALAALMLGSTGCGLLRPRSSQPKAEVKSIDFTTNDSKGAVTLTVLQAKVMRFADDYAITIAQATDDLSARMGTPEARLAALRWKLGQATSAFIDASGPNPMLNALDMLVLVTLARMVAEDYDVKVFGDAALPLVETHRKLEAEAWSLSSGVLKPPQQKEFRDLIEEWRRKNPDQRYIGAVRFREFVSALGRTPRPGSSAPNSIFSLLFLDPLAGLDPTAAAIEETRLLGERAMYYSQRMPMLLSWQTELLAYQLSTQPESRQVLSNAAQLAASAEAFGKVAGQLPALVSSERQAAIQQMLDGLVTEQAKLTEVLRDANKTLSAGNDMATSVNGAIRSLDEFVRFVSPSDTNRTSTSTNHRPFDVLDYGRAAGEIGAAARDLNAMLASLNASATQLTRLSEQTTAQADLVVRHTAWWGFLLIVFLLAGSVLAGLTYRIITTRWLGHGSGPPARKQASDLQEKSFPK